jgi:hypothetical protein
MHSGEEPKTHANAECTVGLNIRVKLKRVLSTVLYLMSDLVVSSTVLLFSMGFSIVKV